MRPSLHLCHLHLHQHPHQPSPPTSIPPSSRSSPSPPAAARQPSPSTLTLPSALLTRHLRNTREIDLLQRVAASATQLDRLMERLYAAIVKGEALERALGRLPHRCPSLPDPPAAAVSSDSSESSSSSSSSDSSAAGVAGADSGVVAGLCASLAPFFQCTFPSAHDSSFSDALLAALDRHKRSIGAVFVELTRLLLDMQDGLGELHYFQQITVRLSEELQLEGCDALAATKAAVAGLEGSLVDRITALLSAQLTYQWQHAEAVTQSHPTCRRLWGNRPYGRCPIGAVVASISCSG